MTRMVILLLSQDCLAMVRVKPLFHLTCSVTRLLDYFSIFDQLQQEKVAPKHDNFAKVVQKFVKH